LPAWSAAIVQRPTPTSVMTPPLVTEQMPAEALL
jgi:hypothetical protein